LLSMCWPQTTPPLFPYTTLFRSKALVIGSGVSRRLNEKRNRQEQHRTRRAANEPRIPMLESQIHGCGPCEAANWIFSKPTSRTRSEEHTSELQSRVDLVCRLLLE